MTTIQSLLARIHDRLPGLTDKTAADDESLLHQMRPMRIDLPYEGRIASFDGANGWLNSEPLTSDGLRGKVVLVNFWTYTCINWLRTLPYVRAWHDKYKEHGLVVISVHTPEFDFEHDLDNVRRAVKELRVEYPVAIDNDYAVWDSFANRYWPAAYFVDAEGQIRYHQFGESGYERQEMVIQLLLAGAGNEGIDMDLVKVDPQGLEVAADWGTLQSGEDYLGYERSPNFASPGGAALDEPATYTTPPRLDLNEWAFAGNWTVRQPFAMLNAANGRIAYRCHARDVNLVMGPAVRGTSVRYRVLIDGQPATAAHGTSVDGEGNGTVSEQGTYQLIRQPQPIRDRLFEIEFLDPGVEVFAFTFG